MFLRLFLFAGALFGSACGEKLDPLNACVDIGPVTYETDLKTQVFGKLCVTCHGLAVQGRDRKEAPVDVNFDTYDAATGFTVFGDWIPDRSANLMLAGKMPKDSSRISFNDGCKVRQWADNGAPQGP